MSAQAMLFASHADEAARAEAIDLLHHATAIYTAEAVVDDLLSRLTWPRNGGKLLDPSCGDGIFLGRALSKLLDAGPISDELVMQGLEGWEIHPFACTQARARIQAVLTERGRTVEQASYMASRIVHHRDFLTGAPTVPAFDAILGNPPYMRYVSLPEILRTDYVGHVPHYASKDLLHSFLDRCSRTLRSGGEMAFVTSDRWLFNAGAAALRESIGQRLSIEHMERLDPKTAFYRPKQRRAGTPPRIHPVQLVMRQCEGRAITRDPIYPGANPELYRGLPLLKDFANVRIAPWLGTQGIFVVTQEQATASKLPHEVLVPAVDTDDVRGSRIGTPTRFAIRTSPQEKPCQEVLDHLAKHGDRMAPRGRRKTPWLPPESFHSLDISQPSLLVPRIAKTPRAVRVPPGVVPMNHNLSIVSSTPEMLDKLEHALNSELAAQWVREHAAPLEGGYFSLTTSLLRQLPVQL